jgi:DedD protein
VNELLKQRLVGALILLALGVIFWPLIFVEPVDEPVSTLTQLPPRPQPLPELNTAPAPPPGLPLPEEQPDWQDPGVTDQSPPEAVIPTQPEPSASPPTTSAPRTAAPDTPQLDERGLPVAWVLQVVALANQQRAESLRDQLLEQGHKAFVRSLQREGTTLYRVYIGPRFEREALVALKREVDTQYQVNATVTRYLP